MQLQEIKKAHFIGVRGIGVSAILRLLSLRGVVLTGSDSARLDEAMLPAGKYHEGHDEDNVESDTSIVIFSPAVPVTNVERMRAQELGIPQFSYPDALALVTSNKRTIAVSGTHGKSTTTALLGKFFESGGYDPSVIVGAEVSGWNHNYRHGDGEVFVVEACEYRRHMMSLSPGVILLTNLELDHPDYYSDLADVMQAFRAYIEKLPTNGKLIYNIDDANLRDITKKIDVETISFGISTAADLCAINILTTSDTQSFTLVWRGAVLGNFSTALPGLYNIYNILGAVATYLVHGGNPEIIQGVLNKFNGIGRRFEMVGKLGSAMVVSDYAHHPTALSAVVEASKSRFPQKRILTVFRPHHRERTSKLFNGFVTSLLTCDSVLLLEIYDVAGREENLTVSSRDLVAEVLRHDPNKVITFAQSIVEAAQLIRSMVNEYDVILVVGAGDADELARDLVM